MYKEMIGDVRETNNSDALMYLNLLRKALTHPRLVMNDESRVSEKYKGGKGLTTLGDFKGESCKIRFILDVMD
jgi:hypothetical protein